MRKLARVFAALSLLMPSVCYGQGAFTDLELRVIQGLSQWVTSPMAPYSVPNSIRDANKAASYANRIPYTPPPQQRYVPPSQPNINQGLQQTYQGLNSNASEFEYGNGIRATIPTCSTVPTGPPVHVPTLLVWESDEWRGIWLSQLSARSSISTCANVSADVRQWHATELSVLWKWVRIQRQKVSRQLETDLLHVTNALGEHVLGSGNSGVPHELVLVGRHAAVGAPHLNEVDFAALHRPDVGHAALHVLRQRAEDAFALIENGRVVRAGEEDLAECEVIADCGLNLESALVYLVGELAIVGVRVVFTSRPGGS